MKRLLLFCFSIFLLLLAFPTTISADTGRKPSVYFDLLFDGNNLSGGYDAALFTCVTTENGVQANEVFFNYTPEFDEQRGCYWKEYFLSKGFLSCEESTCRYNYFLNIPTEIRFALYMQDTNQIYITDPISVDSFDNAFNIYFKSDGTNEVNEESIVVRGNDLIIGIGYFFFSILFEMGIALVILYAFRNVAKLRALISIFFVNVLTLAFLWILAPAMPFGFTFSLFLFYELLILLLEIAFVYVVNKKSLNITQVVVIVGVGNLVTFLLTFVNFLFEAFLYA